MTGLTSLKVEGGLPTSAHAPVLSLPSLEALSLEIDDRDAQPAGLPLQSTRLTRLALRGKTGTPVSPFSYLAVLRMDSRATFMCASFCALTCVRSR
jgi:hypothetical protein